MVRFIIHVVPCYLRHNKIGYLLRTGLMKKAGDRKMGSIFRQFSLGRGKNKTFEISLISRWKWYLFIQCFIAVLDEQIQLFFYYLLLS